MKRDSVRLGIYIASGGGGALLMTLLPHWYIAVPLIVLWGGLLGWYMEVICDLVVGKEGGDV